MERLNTVSKGFDVESALNQQDHQSSLSADMDAIFSSKITFNPPKLESKSRDGKFRILSIDGGGVRGIIPLKILAELEKMVGPISEAFDLIGGTSTGGIISLGLSTPFKENKVVDILDLYQNHSSQILLSNPYRTVHNIAATVVNRFGWRTIENTLVNHPLYSAEGVKNIAQKYMGESLMKDARTNVLITAVDITKKTRPVPIYFTNREKKEGAFLAMQDVARATSAAPMYFPHANIGGKIYIDGGLSNNHPAEKCYTYALSNGIQAKSIYMVSLGTGFADAEGLNSDHHNLLYWAKEIFPIVAAARSNEIDVQLSEALSDRYVRITPTLDHEIPLDDNSEVTLSQLDRIGDTLTQEQESTVRAIAKHIKPEIF